MKVITRKQVAQELGCSESWVDKMTKAGKLPHIRVEGLIRYPANIVEQLFEVATRSQKQVKAIPLICGCVMNQDTYEFIELCPAHNR